MIKLISPGESEEMPWTKLRFQSENDCAHVDERATASIEFADGEVTFFLFVSS